MRFFRRRVWRAIPELDGLNDERARAFVRASMKVGARRAVRWAVVAAAGFFTPYAIVVAYLLIADAFGWWPARLGKAMDQNPGLVWAMGIVGLLVWVSVVWSLRRWLILRGVRMTLFRRTACVRCGAQVLWLPLDHEGAAACVGCGTVVRAEEGLGEIGGDAAQRRFTPRQDVRPSLASFAGYRRRWVRNTVVLASVLAVPVAPFAWLEWTLFRDARLAQSDRTSVAPLNELSRSVQPPSSAWNDPNAWVRFEAARIRIDKADKAGWSNDGGATNANGLRRKPDFGAVGELYTGQSGYGDEQDYLASVKLAEEMLGPYRRAGVFSELREMRSQPRRDMQLIVDPQGPSSLVVVPQLRQVREVARINRARMVVAVREGNLDEFEDAFLSTRALSGMSAEFPSVLGMLVSCATDAIAFGQARAALARHPTMEWVDRIDSAMLRDRARPPRSYAFKGERASALDTLAYAFADRSTIRSRVFETRFGDYQGPRQRVGSYAENRAALEVGFAVLIADADKPRRLRSADSVVRHDLYYSNMLMSSLDVATRSFDQIDTERDGLRTMLALERFRLDHGDYPAALGELVPGLMESLPEDTWSGAPLCYRRLTAEQRAADKQGRGYLLWSVGRDGVDNGGRETEHPSDRYAPFGVRTFSGFDFILNDVER